MRSINAVQFSTVQDAIQLAWFDLDGRNHDYVNVLYNRVLDQDGESVTFGELNPKLAAYGFELIAPLDAHQVEMNYITICRALGEATGYTWTHIQWSYNPQDKTFIVGDGNDQNTCVSIDDLNGIAV